MALESEESRWKGHHLYGDNYFDPKNDPPLLVVYVTEPLKEGSGLSAHTTYLVTTTVFATKKSYCTRKRYKEFKRLFEDMTKLRGVNLSSFPKKKLKKFDYDIVEERRLSFEVILREMADHHQIVIAPTFRKFVEIPLSVNVFPSDFNINSYTARRRSTITARDQPKHQSISKKAPPPPPPSSSQSSVNLTKEQMVNIQIPPPPPEQNNQEQLPVTPITPIQEQQSPVSPVQEVEQQLESPVVTQPSQQTQQPIQDESPHTPVIILQPTMQPPQSQPQQPINVSNFIEEMKLQHQSRQKSTVTSPVSPVKQNSEIVPELDEDIIQVRQAPLPPQRKSQDRRQTSPHDGSSAQYDFNYNSKRISAEEIDQYNYSNFKPMVEEDEAVDQNEEEKEANFNMAMLNLGAQPIKVQSRMSTGHTPYHQIKRDSITSKLADMNPEERVQEILRQIKGETNL